MFLHSHLILAIEDPVKWKYNTKLYREKQKLECEQVWNIVLNKWLSPCLRLWPGPVKCKRNRLLLCYALVFVCLKPQRRWKWEKKFRLHLSLKSKLDIYVSAFTLQALKSCEKLLNFFWISNKELSFFQ